jgi:uncharacterized protein YkwD
MLKIAPTFQMKQSTLMLIAILTSVFVNSQIRLNEWNDALYQNYNSRSFKSLNIVNQAIDPNNIDYPLLNAAIFYRTNEERLSYKRKEFIHSPRLEKAAFEHSKDMVNFNFFSHTSPVAGKKSMRDRIKAVGVQYSSIGENICYLSKQNPTYWELAHELLLTWMDSPGHKSNILDPTYKFIGCGAYQFIDSEWEDFFWVKSTQNFSN